MRYEDIFLDPVPLLLEHLADIKYADRVVLVHAADCKLFTIRREGKVADSFSQSLSDNSLAVLVLRIPDVDNRVLPHLTSSNVVFIGVNAGDIIGMAEEKFLEVIFFFAFYNAN